MEEKTAQEKQEEFNRLKENNFKQQKLSAWRPVPTITSTTITFIVFGVIFLILGIIILVYSNQIQEVSVEYTTSCPALTPDSFCNLTFLVNSTMTAPVMVYYQLNNFYQNHRRYVKSKSNSQLAGSILLPGDLSSDCDPITTVKDLGINKTIDGSVLSEDKPANPCGLIAKSFFTDKFNISNTSAPGAFLAINEKDIAWSSDKELKYKRPVDPSGKNADYWKTIQWQDTLDEHFMVWMRPAGLPNFRKLWGRINGDLLPGNYTLSIKNTYDVKAFDGQKFFVMSTVNSFGGKNSFLGISYIVVGSICIVMAVLFLVGYKIHNSQKKQF
jgi:hypothetical protein